MPITLRNEGNPLLMGLAGWTQGFGASKADEAKLHMQGAEQWRAIGSQGMGIGASAVGGSFQQTFGAAQQQKYQRENDWARSQYQRENAIAVDTAASKNAIAALPAQTRAYADRAFVQETGMTREQAIQGYNQFTDQSMVAAGYQGGPDMRFQNYQPPQSFDQWVQGTVAQRQTMQRDTTLERMGKVLVNPNEQRIQEIDDTMSEIDSAPNFDMAERFAAKIPYMAEKQRLEQAPKVVRPKNYAAAPIEEQVKRDAYVPPNSRVGFVRNRDGQLDPFPIPQDRQAGKANPLEVRQLVEAEFQASGQPYTEEMVAEKVWMRSDPESWGKSKVAAAVADRKTQAGLVGDQMAGQQKTQTEAQKLQLEDDKAYEHAIEFLENRNTAIKKANETATVHTAPGYTEKDVFNMLGDERSKRIQARRTLGQQQPSATSQPAEGYTIGEVRTRQTRNGPVRVRYEGNGKWVEAE